MTLIKSSYLNVCKPKKVLTHRCRWRCTRSCRASRTLSSRWEDRGSSACCRSRKWPGSGSEQNTLQSSSSEEEGSTKTGSDSKTFWIRFLSRSHCSQGVLHSLVNFKCSEPVFHVRFSFRIKKENLLSSYTHYTWTEADIFYS